MKRDAGGHRQLLEVLYRPGKTFGTKTMMSQLPYATWLMYPRLQKPTLISHYGAWLNVKQTSWHFFISLHKTKPNQNCWCQLAEGNPMKPNSLGWPCWNPADLWVNSWLTRMGWCCGAGRRGCRPLACTPPRQVLSPHCCHRSCTTGRPPSSGSKLDSHGCENTNMCVCTHTHTHKNKT